MTTLESERKITEAEQLANKYLPMVPRIAARLHRWYEWVASTTALVLLKKFVGACR